jgi:hypothetical protein
MNYRLQFSPIAGMRESQIDGPSHETPVAPSHKWEDAKFFRSWLVYEAVDEPRRIRGINWSLIFGVALAIAVSAAFWIGLGVLVSRSGK